MAAIFISYRREDSAGYAGRLYDILSSHFGDGEVFIDVDEIAAGQNFAKVIDETESGCSVLLVVIGKNWLAQGQDGRPRLFDPQDFVRLEIAAGLRKNIRVIPLLVGGAVMPRPQQLPEDLSSVTGIEALAIEDGRFHRDADQLIELLETSVPAKEGSSAPRQREHSNLNLIGGLVVLAAVLALALIVWSTRSARPHTKGAHPRAEASAEVPANISGTWEAQVTYSWGDSYKELFKFESEGDALTGTASYLGGGRGDRGILDGKIQGNKIRFTTKSYADVNDKTYEEKHYYLGTVSGDQIRFVLQTDSGYDSQLPQKFVAMRVAGK